MPYERTGYAPWSLTREAGVQSATVDGTIQVNQYGQPNIDIGFIDEEGNWQGRKSSDENFIGFTKDVAIANTASILTPSASADGKWPLDMTGFTSLFIAIKPTNGGNYKLEAVMGPDTQSFANLEPVNPAAILKYSNNSRVSDTSLEKVFEDAAESCTSDVWNIFQIQERCADQKLLQFKITNNSGGNSDIEVAFMRLV